MKRILLGIVIIGVLILRTSANAWAEEYEYDALDRVTKVIYEDGSYVEYEYDSNGNLLKTNVYNANPEVDEGETDNGEEDGGDTKEEEETKPSEGGGNSSGSEESKESTETPESGESGDEDIPQEDVDEPEEKNVVEKIIEAVTGYVNKILDWFRSWFR